MEQGRAEEFDGFVAARWSALFHLSRLLVGGDRHRAEDLLQESLVKLWFVWPKIADEAPEAYVRTVLARAAARSARRRWWGSARSSSCRTCRRRATCRPVWRSVRYWRQRSLSCRRSSGPPSYCATTRTCPRKRWRRCWGARWAPLGPMRRVEWRGYVGSWPMPSSRWSEGVFMDQFERELARMMRDTQEHTPSRSKTGSASGPGYGPAGVPASRSGPSAPSWLSPALDWAFSCCLKTRWRTGRRRPFRGRRRARRTRPARPPQAPRSNMSRARRSFLRPQPEAVVRARCLRIRPPPSPESRHSPTRGRRAHLRGLRVLPRQGGPRRGRRPPASGKRSTSRTIHHP